MGRAKITMGEDEVLKAIKEAKKLGLKTIHAEFIAAVSGISRGRLWKKLETLEKFGILKLKKKAKIWEIRI